MTRRSMPILATLVLMAGQGLSWSVPPPADGTIDWPQYRGANRDGVVSAGAAPLAWPAAGPRVVWKQEAGAGFSQLTVAAGAVFTGLAGEDQEYVVRLDGETGQEIWRTPIGEPFKDQFGDGPRSTPTVDGEILYILSAGGGLHAVRTSDGAAVWSVNLVEVFGSQTPRFGYSPSPLVAGWLLLVEVGGNQNRSLVAFDKKTGDVVWSALSGPAGYSSPVLATLAGEEQVIMPRGTSLTGLGLNGVVLWEYKLAEPAIAMPIPVGGDRVFVSSMGDAGCALVQVSRGPDGFAAETVWENRNMRNHFNSSLVIGDAIYGFDNATLKALDLATGEVRWAHRGLGKGSLIAVDNRLLVLSVKGEFIMVDAAASTYTPLGVFQALEGKSWTAPSYAGGRVYLRNLTQMTCLDLSKGDVMMIRALQHPAGWRRLAITLTGAACLILAANQSPAQDHGDNLESVVARHAAAHGGLAAWKNVKGLRLEGVFEAFSVEAPYVAYHLRPNLYYFQHTVLGAPTVLAFDGTSPWVESAAYGAPQGRVISEDAGRNVVEDAVFGCPLLAHMEAGVPVELLGTSRHEGVEYWELKASPADGNMETWLLDRETGLEFRRLNQTFDVFSGNIEMEMETYYMDFRPVDEIVVAFREERHFGIRYHVRQAEAVQVNPSMDRDMFTAPAPPAAEED